MAYGGVGEVTAEIARVVAGRAAPFRVEFDPVLTAGEVVPVETLALDASEARLARWLEESFRRARAALRRA